MIDPEILQGKYRAKLPRENGTVNLISKLIAAPFLDEKLLAVKRHCGRLEAERRRVPIRTLTMSKSEGACVLLGKPSFWKRVTGNELLETSQRQSSHRCAEDRVPLTAGAKL